MAVFRVAYAGCVCLQLLQAVRAARQAVRSGVQLQQQGISDADIYTIHKEAHDLRFDLGMQQGAYQSLCISAAELSAHCQPPNAGRASHMMDDMSAGRESLEALEIELTLPEPEDVEEQPLEVPEEQIEPIILAVPSKRKSFMKAHFPKPPPRLPAKPKAEPGREVCGPCWCTTWHATSFAACKQAAVSRLTQTLSQDT